MGGAGKERGFTECLCRSFFRSSAQIPQAAGESHIPNGSFKVRKEDAGGQRPSGGSGLVVHSEDKMFDERRCCGGIVLCHR